MPTDFDQWSDAYEAMIDWPKRLAHEEPFYRWVFERFGVRRVVDTACGTGHHAAMFHSWGIEVEGADLSPAMVGRCRGQWGESDTLRWVVRGFDQPAGECRFDAAMCLGNSLALAPDHTVVRTAIDRMLDAVRPGGAVVIHLLNLWRLPDGPCQWQKTVRVAAGGQDRLIIKGVHRSGGRGYVNMLVTDLTATPPQLRSDSVPFLALRAEELCAAAESAGADAVELYGNHVRKSYCAETSPDLILVAKKR